MTIMDPKGPAHLPRLAALEQGPAHLGAVPGVVDPPFFDPIASMAVSGAMTSGAVTSKTVTSKTLAEQGFAAEDLEDQQTVVIEGTVGGGEQVVRVVLWAERGEPSAKVQHGVEATGPVVEAQGIGIDPLDPYPRDPGPPSRQIRPPSPGGDPADRGAPSTELEGMVRRTTPKVEKAQARPG